MADDDGADTKHMTGFKRLLKNLTRKGYSVRRTNGGHYAVTHPNLKGVQVFCASTPSDHRAYKNLRATVRRKLPTPQLRTRKTK